MSALGTVCCSSSGAEGSFARSMSLAEARPTAPGYLLIGIELPCTGDILTVPVSMPPVPGTG